MRRLLACVTLLLAMPALADTALFNVKGYTSTNDGIQEFSVLVFDANGTVVATGRGPLTECSDRRVHSRPRTSRDGRSSAEFRIASSSPE